MKVGYGMIGIILASVAFGILSLLVTSIISLTSLCRKKEKKIKLASGGMEVEFEAAEIKSPNVEKHRASELNETNIELQNTTIDVLQNLKEVSRNLQNE